MIKAREQYEVLKALPDEPLAGFAARVTGVDVVKTIEALREVARLAPHGTLCDAEVASFYAVSCPDNGECDGHKLQHALSALPPWLLEE